MPLECAAVRAESPLTDATVRIGSATSPHRTRVLVLVLVVLLLGLPALLLAVASKQALRLTEGVILGPKFRGELSLASGELLDVSDEPTGAYLRILAPAAPGRRYRWMEEAGVSYADLADGGGKIDFQRGNRLSRIERHWLGFVWVRP